MKKHPFPTSITKEQINLMPLSFFKGDSIVITSDEEVELAIKELQKETILGFDTETRPVFKKGVSYPVSLLQLSTNEKAYLFRLNHINLPKTLVDILTDPKIIKVGVAIRDDVIGLQKLCPFEDESFVELATLAKKLSIKNLGLRSLAAIVLGVRISKGAKLTNWENKTLTKSQINYAATDAWIGREIYLHLRSLDLI